MHFHLSLLFLLFSITLTAQTSITGTLVDSSQTALPAANVVLLNASDSSLINFSGTDGQGRFQINDVPAGNYLIRCSFIGYKRPQQEITVTASDQLLGLGELVMYPEGFFLEGIEVNGYRIPIRMRGDTMVFDADAFGTGPNAVVEDLLRRLPGMTVENDGRILFRGKPVNELMVNGKPFFRGNTQIVTQNLDASAVKNVEVFDQKSDGEIVSGVDDGQEDITLNLEIKEEAKGKFFGQLYAGGGTAERYQAGGKAFRIGDRSQFGALGLFNNLNKTGFNPSTAMGWSTGSDFNFGGNGQDGQLPVGWRGQVNGDNRTATAGLNYGSSIGKKSNLATSYILLDRDQLTSTRQTDIFSGDLTGRRTELDKLNNSKVYSHRITVDFDTKADTVSSFRADLAAFITGQRNRQTAQGNIQSPGQEAIDYNQEDEYRQETPAISGGFSYSRRLGKKGRTLSFTQRNRVGRPEREQSSLITGIENPAILGFGNNGNSRQDYRDQQLLSNSKLSYTQKMGSNWHWQTEAGFNFQERNTASSIFLSDNETQDFSLKNQQIKATLASSIRRDLNKKGYFDLGAKLVSLDWQLNGDLSREQRYRWVLPDFQFSLNGKQSRFLLFLSARPEVPANHQLQAIADPQDVISIRLGNPALDPALNYQLYGYYNFNDQFSGFSLNLNASGNYVDNYHGNDLSFIDGRQLFRAINLSHQWVQTGNFRLDQRLDFIDASIGISSRANLTAGPGSLNDQIVNSNTAGYSLGAQVIKNLNSESFFRLEYRFGKTSSNFDTERNDAIVTSYTNLTTVLQLEFNPKWRLETDFGFTNYSNDLFASDGNLKIWNAVLELRPFKKSPHYFTIHANDLLDQNRNVSRQAFAFYTRSTTTNSLGRYFLLSFHWKL